MWPLDLPAGAVLQLPGATPIPWAVFDPLWYRLNYPEAVEHAAAEDPATLLRYYIETGQLQGHSPNRFFDEAWHRRVYPQIAEAAVSGRFASAFDAYCRRGCLDRSPHWLFDELAYRDRNNDVTPESLAASDLVNGYDHYLRHGSQEDRIGHILFDPGVYLANFAAADIPAIRRQGVFQHYLQRVECGEPELPTSIYFDPVWYLRRYPAVARAIDLGEWKSALHHYLCNETPTEFDPLESFSEAFYLDRDPGLREVIAARHFRNGYMHFLGFGAEELRSPTASIDLAWYAAQPPVRAALRQGSAPNAFAHWLTIGRQQGLSAADPGAGQPAAESQAEQQTRSQPRTPWRNAAIALLPIAGRFGYSFAYTGAPIVSVVMVVRDGFATTLATLASLRANISGAVELVLVDRGSADETRAIEAYLPGVKLLRFESDVGWSRAADAGRQLASGAAILFLAANAQLAPGSVERACGRLAGEAAIGAVGGMLIQPSGVIGQAGGMLWNDGGTHGYMQGESPLAPEANFVRSVDFCSPAFLLLRASLLTQLDGFDHLCAGIGYESVDLCARIIQAGFRVIYDPSVVLFQGEHDPPRGEADEYFLRKHAAYLQEHFAPNEAVQVFARHAGPLPPRVLFIEDTVPLRRIGSGFVRANDLLKVMAVLGCQVTVYPVNGCTHDPARVFGDMADTAEVMHDRDAHHFGEFAAARAGYYDAIWIARTHNLDRIRHDLSKLVSDEVVRPLVILDTEALAPLRQAERIRLQGGQFDVAAAMRSAFVNADVCDAVLAVNADEAARLQALGLPHVSVIGHMIEPRPTPRDFGERAGMLFIGAIHTMDSPNLDSLVWFVEQVLPLVEAELGWETRLTIVGYTAAEVDLERFEHHPRITLRGTVANLEPLYDAHRVFIAPMRFAAGIPYKVFEAASRGLPIVATDLLRQQLGWSREADILSAASDDPSAFAAAVLALYQQEPLWQTIREGALRRLRQDNGPATYIKAVGRVLATSPRQM